MLTLQCIASPDRPEEAVGQLRDIAYRIGVAVETRINGTYVFALPSERSEDVMARWMRNRTSVAVKAERP